MSIDWKKIAKIIRYDRLFLANMIKDCQAVMSRTMKEADKNRLEIVKLRKEIVSLEEKLWRFQYSNNLDLLRKLKLGKARKNAAKKGQINITDFAAILSVHRHTVHGWVNKGMSINDMIDWTIEQDRKYLIRKHVRIHSTALNPERTNRIRQIQATEDEICL